MTDATVDSGAPPATEGKSGSFLSRKVGGVPVKWLILIAVIAGGGYYLYSKYFKKATPITGTAVANGTTVDPSLVPNYGGFDASAGGQVGQDTVMPPTSGTVITTNSQWESAVINGLIGTGAYSAIDVTNALNAALTGQPLTVAQETIYNQAVAAYGAPPVNINSLTTTPAPAVAAPTAPQRTFVQYIRHPSGEIDALYSDGSEVGFPSLAAYKAAGSPKYTQVNY